MTLGLNERALETLSTPRGGRAGVALGVARPPPSVSLPARVCRSAPCSYLGLWGETDSYWLAYASGWLQGIGQTKECYARRKWAGQKESILWWGGADGCSGLGGPGNEISSLGPTGGEMASPNLTVNLNLPCTTR